MKQTRVLIVDDETNFLKVLHRELQDLGFAVASCGSVDAALESLRSQPCEVVVADLHMPGNGGMSLLKAVRDDGLGAEVVMLTGGGTVQSAVEAMKLGAYDYVLKPVDLGKLAALIGKAAERVELNRENRKLQGLLRRSPAPVQITTASPMMERAIALAKRAAVSGSTVLIQGETGTGKELFARFVHAQSARSGQAMITVNCATLPDTLVESELFGHRKGAFTGADSHREGMVELADGGTLFLDEVGELPVALQSKLLRLAQFGEVKRVGDSVPRIVDVRLIAATARDLRAEVAKGSFREDLYYRLNVVELSIPPLRDRPEDIPVIAQSILARWAGGRSARRFSPRSLQILQRYAWPGNVRQLENLVERCLVLGDEELIDLERSAFGAEISAAMSTGTASPAATLEELERHHIETTLRRLGGNREQVARALGISLRSLYYRIKSLGIEV